MSLALAWIAFPAVLSAIALGCGLLLETAAGTTLPGPLLLPAGLAVAIVAGLITTLSSSTASLTTPAVLVLTVAGFVLSRRWRGRFDRWAVAAALVVFAVYAAPIVLSGTATFAGYIKLDDTATWLGLTDRIMDHGRSTAGLAPSSYEATVKFYLDHSGYPIGSLIPLGIGHTLVGQDVAWLFQPSVAFFGAMLALTLYAIVEPLVASRRLRAIVAVVAAQPALLYGYSLWGGIKEVLAAVLIVLLAALVPPLLEPGFRFRHLLPVAVVGAALIGSLSLGGLVWVVPVLLPAAGFAFARIRHRLTRAHMLRIAAVAALVLGLAIPSLLIANGFFRVTTLTSSREIGNLVRPLSFFQVFGVWPVGDLRFRPGNGIVTFLLIAVVLAAALVGLALALRRHAWGLPVYVGSALVGCAAVVLFGSPWVGAKALATASPALVAAAMTCAALFFSGGRRVGGVALGLAIAGGVLWSNALAYRAVWLAPRDQLRELESIGSRFAGQGPTLLTEYQLYGSRHFLRRMDPESASDLRRRDILLRGGSFVPKGGFADIDSFELGGILVYRTLVLGRSPLGSRPPSVYRLAWKGRYYEVWQRSKGRTVLRHVPLGNNLQAALRPSCASVRSLAADAARVGGLIATVPRPAATILPLTQTSFPLDWYGDLSGLYPTSSGRIDGQVTVPADGRYGVWMGGSFPGKLHVLVDGRSVGTARARLDHPGQYTPIGDTALTRGPHHVTLRYEGPGWRPGSDANLDGAMGPLVLSTVDADLPVSVVSPAAAGALCGKSLDWIEIVR